MRSNPIGNRSHTFFVSAMAAAVHRPGGFNAMTDDAAAAVFTLGRERVDGALEAVKIM